MRRYRIYLDVSGNHKPGDPPPEGYIDKAEWAAVQMKAGLKQRRCWSCGLWRFPQEVCHGPEPPDLEGASFTVDDVIEGRKPMPQEHPKRKAGR